MTRGQTIASSYDHKVHWNLLSNIVSITCSYAYNNDPVTIIMTNLVTCTPVLKKNPGSKNLVLSYLFDTCHLFDTSADLERLTDRTLADHKVKLRPPQVTV